MKKRNYFEYTIIIFFLDMKLKTLEIKSLSELKQKSLFMLGYIYHNHIGNFSIAEYYYSSFKQVSISRINSSVIMIKLNKRRN